MTAIREVVFSITSKTLAVKPNKAGEHRPEQPLPEQLVGVLADACTDASSKAKLTLTLTLNLVLV